MTRRALLATLLLSGVILGLVSDGGVRAGKQRRSEVDVFTATGGPVQTTDPGVEIDIPLSQASFVQKAGEVVLVSARATMVQDDVTAFCGVSVVVTDVAHNQDFGLFMERHTDKGDYGEGSDSEAVVAPAVDTPHTLRAFAAELGSPGPPFENEPGCDGPDEFGGGEDTWTVSVRVSVVTLKN